MGQRVNSHLERNMEFINLKYSDFKTWLKSDVGIQVCRVLLGVPRYSYVRWKSTSRRERQQIFWRLFWLAQRWLVYCTVGHTSHDPYSHKKYMEAGVMTSWLSWPIILINDRDRKMIFASILVRRKKMGKKQEKTKKKHKKQNRPTLLFLKLFTCVCLYVCLSACRSFRMFFFQRRIKHVHKKKKHDKSETPLCFSLWCITAF